MGDNRERFELIGGPFDGLVLVGPGPFPDYLQLDDNGPMDLKFGLASG